MREQQDDLQKSRRIRRLTEINRELIETLKAQNDQLTIKISRQKVKPRSHSTRQPTNKQIQSIRKELSNAYKQIDMYKGTLQQLKKKEVPLDTLDRMKELEHRVRVEDEQIDNYQKEIKYLTSIREKQEKEILASSSTSTKEQLAVMNVEIGNLKNELKNMKKNSQKRQEVEKKQHAYYMELEQTLRKLEGKDQQGHQNQPQQENSITEQEWKIVKTKIEELKKIHLDNGKKLDHAIRMRNKERKAIEENQNIYKEKMRKLNSLRNRFAEMTKLVSKTKENTKNNESKKQKIEEIIKNEQKDGRQAKQWKLPQSNVKEQKIEVEQQQEYTNELAEYKRQLKQKRSIGV